MTTARSSKKSETIEVRLSYAAKIAFMARCRQERRTASEAIRLFIDDTIAPHPHIRLRPIAHARIVMAGVVGAMLGVGAAAPSFAHATENSQAAFDRLDRNHDGVLSAKEFLDR
ncbi:EF-hand domain-containing protein [Sphingomonas bacterium]|uniref:EF-hand domain-containing protein n=1 Tax=Sphingomonas bacterium TaxID=1895847 RepID=UPI0015754508|nr:EF-hand domain-containing protein [Sphingomonas bacterium]